MSDEPSQKRRPRTVVDLLGDVRLMTAVAILGLIGLGGCGSAGGNVPKSWQKVDACLEQHPSFTDNVAGDNTTGPGGLGTLSVEGSGGALANAYRFRSHAAAVAAEQGIEPQPSFYGNITLEVNTGTSQGDAAAIDACFAKVYGIATTTATQTTSTTPTTTTTAAPTTAPTSTSPATTTSSPPPCNSSHSASFRCATAAAPYCEQGQCSYPAPHSGACAAGYTESVVPSSSASLCQRPLAGVPTTTTGFTPTPAEIAKAKQLLPLCQREQPGITLQQLEKEAATPLGIQC